ncbi:MAG: hypothetical protein Kow0063_19700 [Anaerolineae bacterium]
MEEVGRTKEQLISELEALRQRVAELEDYDSRRKQLEEEMHRRFAELTILHATLLDITVEHDLSALLYTIVERATQLLEATGGGLYLCDAERREVRCVVSYNTPRDYKGVVLKYGEGAAGKVAETGMPLIIDDYRTWPGRASIYEEEQPFTAVISAPMIWQGEVTGVLHVLHHLETGCFTQRDLELLSLFAHQAAIAVENARLLEAEREQRELAEALREVGIAIGATLDLDSVLDRVLEQIARVVPYDSANLMLVEEGGTRVARQCGYRQFGAEVAREITALSFNVSETANLRWMAETGQPLVIPDTAAYAGWVPLKVTSYVRSWAGAPILVEGQVVAFLSVDKAEPGFYQPKHARHLAAFAGQAAVAIQNARLFEETRRQAEQLESLRLVSHDLATLRDLDTLLHQIVKRAIQLLDGEAGGVFLYDGEREALEWVISIGETMAQPGTTLSRGEGLAGEVWATGEPLIVDDYGCWPGRLPQWAGLSEAVVGVPIQWGGEFLGVLSIQADNRRRCFSTRDAVLLSQFATQSAVAIKNARLFQQAQQEIAERVRAEQALQESKRHLEETLAELKATQQQIVQQERLAAIGQLAAGVAHDFNNLLTSIIGYAELARSYPGVPLQAQSDLARVVRQGRRAAELIRQILDFTRKSTRQPEPLNLVRFLKETAKFLERTIPETIHIQLEFEQTGGLVYADHIQLQQALTNLVVNARDAMPMGGELKLRLSGLVLGPDEQPPCPDMPPGEWVVLSVSDTGVGISADILPRIFEPFFTTRSPEGSGLGLAQVYGIVKQHEGFIDVQSQVGQGATFIIYLPALVVGEEMVEEEAGVKLPRGHGETVLLVEDAPAVLQTGEDMLRHLGYRVLLAGDGQQALAVYAEHHREIDLVLADMVMPEMDGATLFHALKMVNPDVRVVLMTGYPLDEEAPDLLDQGVADWFQKPLQLSVVAQVVSRALQR